MKDRELNRQIVEYIRKKGVVYTQDIAKRFGRSDAVIVNKLRRMAEKKVVFRIKKGYYSVDPYTAPPTKADKYSHKDIAQIMTNFTRKGYELRKVCDELQEAHACTADV